ALKIRSLVGHQIENARVLLRDDLPLLHGVALAEETLEQFARIVLHRQRRRRRAERDGSCIAATIFAITRATAAAAFDRNLERWKWGVLAEVFGRHLVNGHAAPRVLRLPRRHAAQPRAWTESMHRRSDRGLVLQSADNGQVFPVRLERLEDGRHL